jgi:hypothetical protein
MTDCETSDRAAPIAGELLHRMDAYWRAANYLSVGQIYLFGNPLLNEAFRREHIKPRLLGHRGTSPGLNLVYVHLNRVIAAHDLNVLFVTGPGARWAVARRPARRGHAGDARLGVARPGDRRRRGTHAGHRGRQHLMRLRERQVGRRPGDGSCTWATRSSGGSRGSEPPGPGLAHAAGG